MKRTFSAAGGSQSMSTLTRPRLMKKARRAFRRIPTTLALAKGPFPPQKSVTLTYTSVTNRAPALTGDLIQVCPNDIFDFDYTNIIGNKQPLFYDNLLGTNGPYKAWKVKSWELEWKVMNKSTDGLYVFALPTTAAATELDTFSEALDFPGVQVDILGANSSGSNKGIYTITGNASDAFGKHEDESATSGAWNASPASRLFAGLVFQSPNGVTTVDYVVVITAKFKVDLFTVDAVIS